MQKESFLDIKAITGTIHAAGKAYGNVAKNVEGTVHDVGLAGKDVFDKLHAGKVRGDLKSSYGNLRSATEKEFMEKFPEKYQGYSDAQRNVVIGKVTADKFKSQNKDYVADPKAHIANTNSGYSTIAKGLGDLAGAAGTVAKHALPVAIGAGALMAGKFVSDASKIPGVKNTMISGGLNIAKDFITKDMDPEGHMSKVTNSVFNHLNPNGSGAVGVVDKVKGLFGKKASAGQDIPLDFIGVDEYELTKEGGLSALKKELAVIDELPIADSIKGELISKMVGIRADESNSDAMKLMGASAFAIGTGVLSNSLTDQMRSHFGNPNKPQTTVVAVPVVDSKGARSMKPMTAKSLAEFEKEANLSTELAQIAQAAAKGVNNSGNLIAQATGKLHNFAVKHPVATPFLLGGLLASYGPGIAFSLGRDVNRQYNTISNVLAGGQYGAYNNNFNTLGGYSPYGY